MPVQPNISRYALCTLLLLAYLWSQASQGAERLPFTLAPPFLSQQALALEPLERKWLDDRSVLRVGIAIADYEPIDITSDRNRYQGISADYLSIVGARLATQVRVLGFAKREQAVAALQAGEIDLLTNANGYERGITGLAFTRDYMPDRAVVVGRGADLSFSSSLESKRIALLDGYADAATVHRAYPGSEVILAPTLYSAMEALVHGDVDAFIGNEIIVRSYTALRPFLNLQIKFESLLPSTGISFAVRSDNTLLRTLLDRALGDLDESLNREVLRRWTSGLGAELEGQRIRLSADEQQWVRRHAQVTVASTHHPPYIFKDENGQWAGLNIDVLERISRMTGIDFVHQSMPSTQAVLETLNTGKAEMNTTLAETPGRRMFLGFSYAYGGNNWVYVVRADDASPLTLDEMSGKVLAMPMRHALLEFIQNRYPNVRLQLVPTYSDARRLVETGHAQATIQNEAGAWGYPPGNLKVGRIVDGLWSPDRFAVLKAQPELLSILNKALDEFPVAEMRAIRMKWLGTMLPQPSIWQRIPQWVHWTYGIAIVLGLVSFLWQNRLNGLIAQRQRIEEQLHDQQAFTQALLQGLPDPIYVRDLQGRLVSCNGRYEASIGISYEQMSGRRVIDVDLIPREQAEQMHADDMALLRTREAVLADSVLVLADRRIDTRQWRAPFYRADGQLQGVLGGWTDISELKRLEQALAQARLEVQALRS